MKRLTREQMMENVASRLGLEHKTTIGFCFIAEKAKEYGLVYECYCVAMKVKPYTEED